jgi:hypothetical protein
MGFVGGKITELKPEMRMQALVVAQRIPANAGETVKAEVGPATVAVTAINADDGSSVAVPVADHAVAWTAPAGHWTVMVVEHQFKTSPTRSDTNPKRVKDGTQSLEDYLDPAATAQYLAFTQSSIRRRLETSSARRLWGFVEMSRIIRSPVCLGRLGFSNDFRRSRVMTCGSMLLRFCSLEAQS